MVRGDDSTREWVQLATRIPKTLHRAVKLRCVESETSLMVFVVDAVQEKLAREAGARRRKRPPSK